MSLKTDPIWNDLLSLKVLAANSSRKSSSMNHERRGWWQEEERPGLESLESWHEDLFGSQQSLHTVVSCSCVKGGSALQGFLPCSLGQTPAKEFFKLECTNNNKLDRLVLKNLKFQASLEFSRHACPLSALSSPWWTGGSVLDETWPNRWQCCHPFFLTCMFFFEELPGCNLASNSHQPIILTYTLKLFFFFFQKLYTVFSTNWSCFPKRPLTSRPCQRWNQTRHKAFTTWCSHTKTHLQCSWLKHWRKFL